MCLVGGLGADTRWVDGGGFNHHQHEVKFACDVRSLPCPLGQRAVLKQAKQCFKLGTFGGHSGNAVDWLGDGVMVWWRGRTCWSSMWLHDHHLGKR